MGFSKQSMIVERMTIPIYILHLLLIHQLTISAVVFFSHTNCNSTFAVLQLQIKHVKSNLTRLYTIYTLNVNFVISLRRNKDTIAIHRALT